MTKAASTVAAGIAATLLAGCGGSARHGDTAATIHRALTSRAGDAGGYALQFPATAKTVACVIHGGGPFPGMRVPGTCATVVVYEPSGSAVVRFVERWDSRRFHGMGDPRGRLSHTWELAVSSGGKVTYVRQYGDVAPQEVP